MKIELESILAMKNINAANLAIQNHWRITKSGLIERVTTAPNKLYFLKKEFIGSFVFENSKLCFINLIPIIENINVPNYPCEEYQNLKKEYNINLLKKTYGEDYTIKGNKIEWKCSSYAISVETIENGKNRYTGGNIKIILERI